MGSKRNRVPRIQTEAPTINGFVVPMRELELPSSNLDTELRINWNNHHHYFTAARLGQFVMTQLFRDLDANQTVLPRDTHAIYHDRYSPPELPSLYDIMDRLDEAYQTEEPLRYGSASLPTYRLITPEQMHAVHNEYNELS